MCREFNLDREKKRKAAAKDRSCVPRNDWRVRFDCESRQRGLNAIQRSHFSVYWTVYRIISMPVTIRLTPEWSTWENARLVSFRRKDRNGQPDFENAISFILTTLAEKIFIDNQRLINCLAESASLKIAQRDTSEKDDESYWKWRGNSRRRWKWVKCRRLDKSARLLGSRAKSEGVEGD